MVVFLKNNGSEVHCSGSLIHERYVLSASHCFTNKSESYIPVEDLLVVLSVFDIRRALNPFFQSVHRKIKKVKFHPDYDYPKAYSDISLIELNETVPLRDSLSTICLPDIEDADPDFYGISLFRKSSRLNSY